MAVSAKYYKDSKNNIPFKSWFDGLDANAADFVNDAIRKRRNGIVSHSESLGGGVHELKTEKYRIYYGHDGNQLIILLGGGTKQRQQKDIDAAKRCWQDCKALKKKVAKPQTRVTLKPKKRKGKETQQPMRKNL